MKIIFLDIDGVLNTDRQLKINELEGIQSIRFDDRAMNNLKHIVNETKAKIVITSTWRIHRETNGYLWKELIRNFKECGLNEESITDVTSILDKTMKPKIREHEIKNWLHQHKDVETFVILDDQWSMGELEEHFIRCLAFSGITDEIAKKAVIKLKKT